MFEEMLGNFWLDNFTKTVVLAVGVSPYFFGFSMEKQLFWYISCTCLAKQSFQMVADLDRNTLKIV